MHRRVLAVALFAAGCGGAPGPLGPTANPPPRTPPGADGGPGTPGTSGPGPTVPCAGMSAQPLDSDWTVTLAGTPRVFHVHVPARYDPSAPTPVVLNFHGFSSNGLQEILLSRMTAKADTAGFIAVHPEGLGAVQSWNAGACCGDAVAKGVDDVAFTQAMLDALEAKLCVDPKRIYVTGMSNGGFMSHRLACELSSRIAAVAPVAGVMVIPSCAPARPVPVIEFHGTADSLVPYLGDPVLGFPSVPSTFSSWAQRDGCVGAPVKTYGQIDSSCSTYETCGAGTEVTLCTVDLGGHTWPGGTPVPTLGYTTTWLSATDAMWDFFQRHPLP